MCPGQTGCDLSLAFPKLVVRNRACHASTIFLHARKNGLGYDNPVHILLVCAIRPCAHYSPVCDANTWGPQFVHATLCFRMGCLCDGIWQVGSRRVVILADWITKSAISKCQPVVHCSEPCLLAPRNHPGGDGVDGGKRWWFLGQASCVCGYV